MEALRSSSARQVWTLVAGGAAIVVSTLILALLFLQGIIQRLAVLRDNARRFGEGKPLNPPLSGRDEITEVDHAFHDMADNLGQQKQENEMFVYSVSHDLRSPLVNLQGFSEELSLSCGDLRELFRRDDVPEPVRRRGMQLMDRDIEESIRFIQAAVGRLARIIDALLRLSRAGRVEYQWQEVDLSATVGKIVAALHDTITAKGAQVAVGALPPAWGDPTALEQVFANLIGNAVQYLDPDRPGRIEIEGAEPEGAGLPPGLRVYRVRDNGLGIPEAYHQRMFTAFSRFHAGAAQGEGIGLALVRRMVERHGGRIWLESSPGAGTTFFVALPTAPGNGPGSAGGDGPPQAAAAGPRPAQPRTTRRSQPMGTEPLLIVLAEDDDGHASLVQRNLERAGLANGLERLKDGQEALDFIRGEGPYAGRNPSQQPVLLLLDIKMPRVDGVEVLRQIKADPRTALIPVIMLTTTDDPREIQRCYELGCSVYITKPVDYQGFVEAIKRLGLFLQVVRVPSH